MSPDFPKQYSTVLFPCQSRHVASDTNAYLPLERVGAAQFRVDYNQTEIGLNPCPND